MNSQSDLEFDEQGFKNALQEATVLAQTVVDVTNASQIEIHQATLRAISSAMHLLTFLKPEDRDIWEDEDWLSLVVSALQEQLRLVKLHPGT
jgi:hypothetical protein